MVKKITLIHLNIYILVDCGATFPTEPNTNFSLLSTSSLINDEAVMSCENSFVFQDYTTNVTLVCSETAEWIPDNSWTLDVKPMCQCMFSQILIGVSMICIVYS